MIDSLQIQFDPSVPWPLIALVLAGGVGLAAYALWRGARGSVLRGMLALLAAALLANPTLVREEREALDDIVVIAVDRSDSQKTGDRMAQTDVALRKIRERLDKSGNFETRVVTIVNDGRDGTRMMDKIDDALSDVEPARLASIIALTDGQLLDADTAPELPGTPFHALVTGTEGEADRRLTIVRTPSFGIVGEPMTIELRVDDDGTDTTAPLARVRAFIDGVPVYSQEIETGAVRAIPITIDHAGPMAIEVEVEEGPREITLINNRAALLVNGVRDRLRVLLVSGEPHSGERVWRDLLKADPSVDLVHFTILRPPEKQDGTPIRELSLIAFPTRQLFSAKLDEFDLIIFDRYRRRGVLPMLYLDNVGRYVEDGGAVLIATGPAYAGPRSLSKTPIAAILPAIPTGNQIIGGFRPQVTDEGRRHPVTAPLAPPPDMDPTWGRWFRVIESDQIAGNAIMAAPTQTGGEVPLLILDRVGEGRVAQLMSDHAWLWARGLEGGGPQAELLRRLGHWLMKEPDLEEERLSLTVEDDHLKITRRTMDEAPPPVTLIAPDGGETGVTLEAGDNGIWTARVKADSLGLFRVVDPAQSAVAAVGPLNPQEFTAPLSTTSILRPVAENSGGLVTRLEKGVPGIRRVGAGRSAAGSAGGSDWIGLRRRDHYRVTDVRQVPLVAPLLAMLLAVGLAMITWRQEGG